MNEDPKTIAELRNRISELEQANAANKKRIAILETSQNETQSELLTLRRQVENLAATGNK